MGNLDHCHNFIEHMKGKLCLINIHKQSLYLNTGIWDTSEVSQALKDNYHMISPMSGTQSTKQTNEQKRTRDMKIKNKLTVTRGMGGGG